MDNPPRPEEGYTNAGCNLPAADASSPTTYDETYEAALQTAEQDVKYLMNNESNRNTSMLSSDGSVRTNQAMLSTFNRYENTSSSMNSQGSFSSSSLDVSREFDISVVTRNQSVPYGSTMFSSVPIRNWNRGVPNYRMTTEINHALKRTRSEIWGKIDKSLSTDCEEKYMNYYKTWEINTIRQTSSDSSLLAGIDHKIQTIKQTVSNNPQNPILIKRPLLVRENIAYNTNVIDKSQSNAPIKVLGSIPFKRESIRSADNIVGVTGSSDFNRNDNSIDISGNTFLPCFLSKMRSIKRVVKKELFCNVCKSKVSIHIFDQVKNNFFECCICTYNSCDEADLQMHSDTHLPKTFCNVCQKEHTEGNSHVGKHKCAACEQTFKCKTELNEHISQHNNYFKGHCWVCSMNLDDHFKEEEGVEEYKCCICPFKSKEMKKFTDHTGIHRPKIFCRICKEEYCKELEVLHKREFVCVWCKQTFPCQPMLEDHTKDNESYFYWHCSVCNKKIENDHKTKTGKIIFYCCKCFKTFKIKHELQNHLYSHTSLNLFKCYCCGRRFAQEEGVTNHSRSCPAVPYKCEKCQARFPRKDFLDLHCSVKHKKVSYSSAGK